MGLEPFFVRFAQSESAGACPMCGASHGEGRGPYLFHPEHAEPLCRLCSKRLAPDCGALLELAATAERIGRHGRHLLTPPMEALLDLARAAENYATATTGPGA